MMILILKQPKLVNSLSGLALLLLSFVTVTAAVTTTTQGLKSHKRHCCKYSFEEGGGSTNNLCENSSSCIVEHSNSSSSSSLSNLVSAPLDFCRVLGDSKRDIATLESRKSCLDQAFVGEKSSKKVRSLEGMFELKRYTMESDVPQNEFRAIEVVLPSSQDWFSVKFRIFDLLLCPNDEMSESCAPRCVDIEKRESKKNPNSGGKIVYDCEGGFYVSDSQSKAVRSTDDDSYQFDICFESITDGKACGSYLFEMGGSKEDVVLVHKDPLVNDKKIVMQMSESMKNYLFPENDTSKLEIYRISDLQNPQNGNNELVQYFDMEDGDENSVYELHLLPDGDYMISILAHENERMTVAKFQLKSDEIEDSDTLSVGLISFLTILIISGVAIFIIYKRYIQVQKQHQVSPHRLLESGRIKPKDVFIVTNVDNRHHIDIILNFGKYLKSHCAVGEVYFALDPETGFTTQTNHDPWKWAQSVAEKMAETGCLIFIGAPPEHTGISIYKDLPNNQAFISTMYLKKMSDENRVAVALFPYSDPDTLPALIPPHLKANPYHLPADMNSFLCQLLEVKKRAICSCLPIPIVPPEILPHNLSQYRGGKELQDQINNLTAKVDLAKAELVHERSGAGSTLSRMFDEIEKKQLLRPEPKKKATKNGSNSNGLKIDLESNLYSIKNPEFESRDKNVHPEFEQA